MDIIIGAWQIKRNDKVQQIYENIFKLNFELNENKDLIFYKRP